MPLGDITVENTVKIWSELRTFGSVTLNFFLVLFGLSFLFAMLYYPVVPPPGDPIYSIQWLLIIPTIVITPLRNRIIKRTFAKINPTKFYQFVYYVDQVMNYLLIIFMVSTLFVFFSFVERSLFRIWSLSLSFVCLFAPFFVFWDALTDSGKTRIIFNTFLSNIDDFYERQKWMKLAFKKLENKLKKGKIEVSLDKLISHCNLKLINAKDKDIKGHLVKIEQWILGKQTENVVDSLVQIIPKDEIKQLEKKSILDIYNKIPSELRSLLVFVIALIIFACFFPEYVKEIIKLPFV